jgi:GNAT superfamily N-acetyltransferase
MTTPTIRRGTRDDAGMLAEMAARIFHDTFAAENSPEDMRAYMDEAFAVSRQAEEIDDPRSTFLLAFVDDEPAGYAKLYAGETPSEVAGERPVELARLYADHRWHGRGVGGALMQACFDEARRAGYATMWLGVWERNFRAIAFYQKVGFVECGSHPFQLGSDLQTDLLMSRPL